ncbi:MAG: hypothetical protein SWH54_03855 [Thermodesulfobacteriota bacterium]|nr:hypothetical protein [Thermodesulfobacteriota bacterium]
MKPIYFPFTYISKPVAEALHACFGKTIVYHPSSKNIPEESHQLAEYDMLDIRIPVKKDEEKLSVILKEYDAWANLHQGSRGGQLDFVKTRKNKIPFFNDTSTSQIKADIKHIADESPDRTMSDSVFNARIFLSIAQNFDMQNDKVVQDIASVETARVDLMKSLQGEDGPSPLVPGYQDTFKTGCLTDDDHMIAERIAAWALLMCRDPRSRMGENCGLFVTSSRQAIDHLLEKTPEAKSVLSIDAIPMVENQLEKPIKYPEDMMEYLNRIAESSQPVKGHPFTLGLDASKCNTKVSLSLYVVPATLPGEYFSRFTDVDSSCEKIEKGQVGLKNTLIGHIGFSA